MENSAHVTQDIQGTEPVFELAVECETLYANQINSSNDAGNENAAKVLSDLYQRFSSWAAFLGVFAESNVCLDQRLRRHADIQDQVLRLLDIMRRNLICFSKDRDPTLVETGLSVEIDRKSQFASVRLQSLNAISAALERLNQLGTAIQRSLMAKQISKAREITETFDLTSFEQVAYMSLKMLYPDCSESLIEQLTRSMVEAYALFLHRKSRKARLEVNRSLPTERQPLQMVPEEPSIDIDDPGSSDMYPGLAVKSDYSEAGIAHTVPVRSIRPLYRAPQSQPTSVDTQEVNARLKRLLNPSIRSKPMSILVNKAGYPRANKESLVCEWCFGPLTPDSLEGLKWQQHVNEDFEPYVCVSENCLQPLIRFSSSAEWLQHMIIQHGSNWQRDVHAPSSWICPLCIEEDVTFHSPDCLSKHLEIHHDGIFRENQVKAIIRQSKFPTARPLSECPLCCLSVTEEHHTVSVKPNTRDNGPENKDYLPTPGGGGPKRIRIDIGKMESRGTSANESIIATHVTAHLQNIMLLTLRLMSIEEPTEGPAGSQSAATDTDNQVSEDPSVGGAASDQSRTNSTVDLETAQIPLVFNEEELHGRALGLSKIEREESNIKTSENDREVDITWDLVPVLSYDRENDPTIQKMIAASRAAETSETFAGSDGSLPNPKNDISKPDEHDAKDFWQMAYNELTESDRNTLAALLPATTTKPQDVGGARTKDILDEVVKATEAQYREKGGKDGFRATVHRVLNSVLSFQDVVSNTAKFDPTGYASSAWAIVSLGLTMTKNHADLQGALFDSSGYLADLLAYCAFIEEQFYRGRDPVTANVEKEQSIIRVYVAILRYSAEVRRVQQFNKGKDIVESITAIAGEPLTQLKTSIKEEEPHLHHWLALDQHLHRKKEADAILTHLDKMRDAVNMLNLPFAKGAFFDSYEDQHEGECLSGTRTELLQQVQDWGRSSDKHIFWLSGMAGTGKSTIARTVARSFKEDGILGASFFFKRGEGDRGSAAKFFSTIVKQLADHIPQMVTGIRKAIEDDPAIPASSLREQFNKLMLQPLLTMDYAEPMNSTVVVIDALDECEQEEDVEIILDLLPRVETATKMVIRFFLTSRPESPIRFGFDQIDKSNYQKTILQNLDDNVIKHDITLYLKEEFSQIQQKCRRDLPLGWPGEERIRDLAAMAFPLFIFAATVCRFVSHKNFDPEERLQEFFTDSSGSKLDIIYRPILNQLLTKDKSDTDKLVEEFQKTIGVIILLAAPLSLSSLAELLEMPADDINTRLDSFHSVLTIPSDPNLPIQTFHLSFHDYLMDERTKLQKATYRFWVDKREKHELIARKCLTVMDRYLRKNICDLPSYGTSRTEIHPASIARFLPPALQYACRYWVYHLTQSSAPAKSLDQVLAFLKEHFLHWLEAMSILGMIPETIIAVDTLLQLTKGIPNNEIYVFLLDARRFILKFAEIIDTTPLQLYSSGLIFAPHKALIRENFERELPAWLFRSPKVEEFWNPEIQTLEGHSHSVQSVAFSGDGQLLASGSEDNTIKLWDPATGTLKHTLEGHSDWVLSVAFSGDGQLLASGSEDNTIKLWNTATNTLKHTLEGHSDWVLSVAFSGDGQLLASGSEDNTIKLWDAATSALKHTLEGHSDSVQSVAFSGDGQLLASGSEDNTIKLWDAATGALKHTLEGHSDWVLSVAFSGDGQLLASGSEDNTIKLWDAATDTPKYTLEGHSGSVWSVAFSGDGQLLASGSEDNTIKLWDPATGALMHALEGHSGSVWSVAFSGDCQLLASGSYDKTIKLWDPATGAPKYALEGHSGSVRSVAFSGDGQLLASGSEDNTIKLWDAATGALKQTLSTGAVVTNVEFSKHLPQLITNLGSFDIQICYESFSSNPSEKVTEVSLRAGRWITIQGQRELWLPPNYQPSSLAVRDSTIALGCTSGRVVIIAFSIM